MFTQGMLRYSFYLLSLALLLNAPAQAADRALLIGVGKFAHYQTLEGIDLDVDRMEKVAMRLGFDKENIKRLADKQATEKQVQNTLRQWLVQGVTANDRVLIYFSGHGSRVPDLNGDEEDGVDEVLVLHDAQKTTIQGKASLKGVLLDDDFGKLLANIAAKEILVIIDACHSGTATKGAIKPGGGVGKSFSYTGMPEPATKKGIKPTAPFTETTLKGNSVSRQVVISAAADNEEARATDMGSTFTLAIHEEIINNSPSITPRLLKEAANRKTDPYNFHPQLSGNPALFDTPLLAKSDNWQALQQFADSQTNKFPMAANRSCLVLNEKLQLAINLPHNGYLNVVAVDSKDEAIVVFPNQYQPENFMQAGPLTLPQDEKIYTLSAQPPLGKNLLVALLSDQPVNYYQDGLRSQNSPFASFSPHSRSDMKKGIKASAGTASNGSAVGKVELMISGERCQ